MNLMKRDFNLIREILFRLESLQPREKFDPHFEGYSDQEVSYHLYLLVDAKLIEAVPVRTFRVDTYIPQKITWAGHEFLDSARNDALWDQATHQIKSSLGSVSLTVLTQLLIKLALQRIQ